MFLLFCIQKAIDARFSFTTAFDNVFDPKTLVSFPILPCEDNKFFTKLHCFDFVWSGNDSQRITSIVQKIMDNNPGRPIPSNKVPLGFSFSLFLFFISLIYLFCAGFFPSFILVMSNFELMGFLIRKAFYQN